MKKNESWEIVGESIIGASHIRNELPNQDAIGWGKKGNNIVLVASDGHGSLKHFRSKEGSRIAVESAKNTILQEIDVDNLKLDNLKFLKNRIEEKLPLRIVKKWKSEVVKYHNNNPFNEDEEAIKKLKQIEDKYSYDYRNKLEQKDNLFKVYGATLLAVLITPKFILYLKLGDGDLLTVSNEDKVNRVFSNSEKKIGDETKSLCMDKAFGYFKVKIKPTTINKPLLIFVSTDGYSDSYREDSDFLNLPLEYKNKIVNNGVEYIKNKLPEWLTHISKEGSGDDITLGVIFNKEIIAKKLGYKLINKIKYGASFKEVEELINKGANINIKNTAGRTPLMQALCQNVGKKNKVSEDMREKIVKMLIENGAKVNQQDRLGMTPLILEIRNYTNSKIIKLLIESGADVQQKSINGNMAIDFLKNKEDNEEIFKLLQN